MWRHRAVVSVASVARSASRVPLRWVSTAFISTPPVTQFGWRHQQTANPSGGSPLSSPDSMLLLDNITLYTPEPTSLLLLVAAVLPLRRRDA